MDLKRCKYGIPPAACATARASLWLAQCTEIILRLQLLSRVATPLLGYIKDWVTRVRTIIDGRGRVKAMAELSLSPKAVHTYRKL